MDYYMDQTLSFPLIHVGCAFIKQEKNTVLHDQLSDLVRISLVTLRDLCHLSFWRHSRTESVVWAGCGLKSRMNRAFGCSCFRWGTTTCISSQPRLLPMGVLRPKVPRSQIFNFLPFLVITIGNMHWTLSMSQMIFKHLYFYLFILHPRIYPLILGAGKGVGGKEGGRERERERERKTERDRESIYVRETSIGFLSNVPWLGTKPATQACE